MTADVLQVLPPEVLDGEAEEAVGEGGGAEEEAGRTRPAVEGAQEQEDREAGEGVVEAEVVTRAVLVADGEEEVGAAAGVVAFEEAAEADEDPAEGERGGEVVELVPAEAAALPVVEGDREAGAEEGAEGAEAVPPVEDAIEGAAEDEGEGEEEEEAVDHPAGDEAALRGAGPGVEGGGADAEDGEHLGGVDEERAEPERRRVERGDHAVRYRRRVPLALAWLRDFALTLLVETPVYALGLRGRMALPGVVVIALALNVATHPIAWRLIVRAPRPAVFIGVEIGVWLVEAALLYALGRRRGIGVTEAVIMAFAANALSAGLPLLLVG